VAGLLRPHLSVPVNEVNALLLAGERGLKVSETRRPHAANFTSSVSLRVGGPAGERFVKGTVYQAGELLEPRVAQIDRYLVDAVPSGTVLIVANQDKPGVIGAVGTVLGSRGINVSRMQVGLDEQAGEALELWNVDGELDAAALDAVRAAPHVRSATLVKL
jgi:D-3-phosphoglycerate dehydrogenase